MQERQFLDQASVFLERLHKMIRASKLVVKDHWDIDHLCFRVSSQEQYQLKKQAFSQFGILLAETEVNGRPISTFRLNHPVEFYNRMIDLVELPAPKTHSLAGRAAIEGFEHIEIVVDEDLKTLAAQYPQISLGRDGFSKDLNRELEFELGQFNVKFHQISLDSVIRIESNAHAWSSLNGGQVLQKLREFGPAVVGALPLGLAIATSPVDIVVQTVDSVNLKAVCDRDFAHCDGYHFESALQQGAAVHIARFDVQGIQFNIIGQLRSLFDQKGFRQFQMQEKLLKYGGASLRSTVMEKLESGSELDKAFRQSIPSQAPRNIDTETRLRNLDDDSAEDENFSALQKMSIADLRRLLGPTQKT